MYIYCIIKADMPARPQHFAPSAAADGQAVAAPEGNAASGIADGRVGLPQTFGPHGIGGRGDEVYCVYEDGLAAVVSRAPIQKFKMSRDNLLAHERAIEGVMKTYNVLPVRFATVAESEEKVRKILLKEKERFSTLLQEMEGRKEMGLKAFFK